MKIVLCLLIIFPIQAYSQTNDDIPIKYFYNSNYKELDTLSSIHFYYRATEDIKKLKANTFSFPEVDLAEIDSISLHVDSLIIPLGKPDSNTSYKDIFNAIIPSLFCLEVVYADTPEYIYLEGVEWNLSLIAYYCSWHYQGCCCQIQIVRFKDE